MNIQSKYQPPFAFYKIILMVKDSFFVCAKGYIPWSDAQKKSRA